MSAIFETFYIYLVPLSIILAVYFLSKNKVYKKNISIQKEEFDAGLTEPPSLHPVINESICLGCNACVEACPEKSVLGLVHRKANLITPSNCIGHGACRVACPFDAITLVFGTEKRGLDIPFVKPDFETNVSGIYIAGELGGMGLIRNAIEQGRQAMEYIYKANEKKKAQEGVHDVVIIGAGPAGFSASLGAIEKKMSYVTLEQDTLGGTVSHYPRGKLVMTQPATLPIYGKTKFTNTSKESLMEFWEDVERKTGAKMNYSERVDKVEKDNGVFVVTTTKGEYKAKAILLAIGRRGTPRKLGVEGEELSKVVYRMIDPEQYKDSNVLVVGGGDSALEAAASIAEITSGMVTISYRGEAFGRAKQKNRDRVNQAESSGKLRLLMKSNTKKIYEDRVALEQDGEKIEIKNDAIIVCAGGILPTGFLKEMGVEVETKHGEA